MSHKIERSRVYGIHVGYGHNGHRLNFTVQLGPSLTRKRSLVRVQLRPQLENEPLGMPVERFLASVRFEH